MGILLKDYSDWALRFSTAVKEACLAEAVRRQRPVRYLRSSGIRKDERARHILHEHRVSDGLVCAFTCLVPCRTFRVRGNPEPKRLELRAEQTKCLHVYKYWIDSQFGFLGARLQTWFPCEVQVWINGREWLARRLDRKGIDYRRHDNCFPWIADFPAAQKLSHQMQRTPWIRSLNRLLERLCPDYSMRLGGSDCYPLCVGSISCSKRSLGEARTRLSSISTILPSRPSASAPSMTPGSSSRGFLAASRFSQTAKPFA